MPPLHCPIQSQTDCPIIFSTIVFHLSYSSGSYILRCHTNSHIQLNQWLHQPHGGGPTYLKCGAQYAEFFIHNWRIISRSLNFDKKVKNWQRRIEPPKLEPFMDHADSFKTQTESKRWEGYLEKQMDNCNLPTNYCSNNCITVNICMQRRLRWQQHHSIRFININTTLPLNKNEQRQSHGKSPCN